MGWEKRGKTVIRKNDMECFRTPTNSEFRCSIFLRVYFPLYFELAFQILINRSNTFLFLQMYTYKAIIKIF